MSDLSERDIKIRQECPKHELIGCQVCTPPDGQPGHRQGQARRRRVFSDPVVNIMEEYGTLHLSDLAVLVNRPRPAVRVTVRFLEDVYGVVTLSRDTAMVTFKDRRDYDASRRRLGTQWDWPGER